MRCHRQPKEADVYRALELLWAFLLREYRDAPPDTVDKMAVDIACAIAGGLPLRRVLTLNRLAKAMVQGRQRRLPRLSGPER